MTAAEFKTKWSRYRGKETSACQSHFDDLCRLLGHRRRRGKGWQSRLSGSVSGKKFPAVHFVLPTNLQTT
jgi:hypothetical protein